MRKSYTSIKDLIQNGFIGEIITLNSFIEWLMVEKGKMSLPPLWMEIQ